MPESVGTAYMTVLADMTKFGTSASTQLKSSSASMLSTAKTIGATLGLTLGATALVGFAKDAFAAFEEAEKSMRLFSLAAKDSQVDVAAFNQGIDDMQWNLAIDDEKLRDLATQLLNMGFEGSTKQLLAEVQAIQDIAVATGKSETMIQRMFVSLNTGNVTGALMMMKRLGLLTGEQAIKFKEMAAAGSTAEVQVRALAIAEEKMAGSAESAVTPTQRLHHWWDETVESAGGAFDQIARGINLYDDMTGAQEAASKVAERWVGWVKDGARAGVDYTEGMGVLTDGTIEYLKLHPETYQKKLNEAFEAGTISVEDFRRGMALNGKTAAQQNAEITRINRAIRDTAKAEKQAASATSHYLGLMGDTFQKWRKDTVASLEETFNSLGKVDLTVKRLGPDFQHSFKVMIASTRRYVEAAKELAGANPRLIPEGFKQWLVDQGPEAMVGFTELSKKQQQADISQWEKHEDEVHKFGGIINDMSHDASADFNTAKRGADDLRGSVSDLNRQDAHVNIDVEYRIVGGVNPQSLPGLSGNSSGGG